MNPNSRRVGLRRFLGILLWLAVRGLLRPGRRIATLISGAALLLLTAIAIDTLGLYQGHYAVQERQLLDDPWVTCLWVGHAALGEENYTPERLKGLSELLKKNPHVRMICPSHEMNLYWFMLDSKDSSTPVRGRTYSREEPLYPRLRELSSFPPGEEEPLGVYVTEKFWQIVQASSKKQKNRPKLSTLEFYAPDGQRVTTKVLGTIPEELPWDYQFLASEDWYKQYITAHDRKAASIQTGPLPKSWPCEPPETVLRAFSQYRLFGPRCINTSSGEVLWEIETYESKEYHAFHWRGYLKQIARLMSAEGYQEAEEKFFDFSFLEPAEEQSKPFQVVSVYVHDIDGLRPVKELLEHHHHYVRDANDIISKLEKLRQSASATGWVLVGILAVLAIGLLIILAGVQVLRIELRVSEIAMLKAMGMSTRGISALFAIETIIVWLCSTVFGLLLGWPIGKYLLAPFLIASADKYPHLAFSVSLPLLAVVSGVIFVLTVAINVAIGARKAVAVSPVTMLQAT